MALKATIFKAELRIADLDRSYYCDHALTLARHPSETDERMMVRLLAFALHAGPALEFTRGLSTESEPDLWQKDLSGGIQTWIEIGQPDAKRLRQACSRAARVLVYTYSRQGADRWWEQLRGKVEGLKNLSVMSLPAETGPALTALARRSMHLNCTIQEGQAWLADEQHSVAVEIVTRKR